MKKLLKYLSLAMMLSLLLVPAVKAKAAYSQPVKVESRTANSFTVSWQAPAAGTTYYYKLGIGTSVEDATTKLAAVTPTTVGTTNTCTIPNLTPGTKYTILVQASTDNVTFNDHATVVAVTLPAVPKNIRQDYWRASDEKTVFSWDCDGNAAGFQLILNDGVDKVTKETTEKTCTYNCDDDATKLDVTIRSYVIDTNNSKIFSEWSETYRCFGQPMLKENDDGYAISVVGSKLKLEWEKEPRANGYEIYIGSKRNGTYKKVKTINGKDKTKATLSKDNKNKKFKKNKDYYVYVLSFRKDNGKITRSSSTYLYFYHKGETYMTLKK
ncbi:fibronectin type III domain-containing protein [Butyrivibrio sp. AD3002]|uniref:fibronectin type III domain-containing protein n=1 Tax=Butyrivibrio sp. AD3002 TaxID=1280670 RepID=UPI0003B44C14|nr:fibronectin type III domain-containing protein [Butyrivibrio sp. AD3002]